MFTRIALAGLVGLFAPVAMAQPAKDTITVAFAAEGTTLDPVKYSAGADSYEMSQMFEQLLRPVPPDWKEGNWLAESWSVGESEGKQFIDVRLRKGVLFQNGEPLTAEDFAFAYEQQRDPKKSHYSHLWTDVESFEIIDPLHFREPDATIVADNLRLWAIPKHYIEKVGWEEFGRHPIGTGPWTFVSRSIKDEIRFDAFDGYWNKEHRPTARHLIIKIIPEDLTRVAAFKTGAVDMIDSVPVAMVDEIKHMPGVHTATVNTGNNVYFNFATQLPNSPFRDPRVRQAAAMAVDVKTIIAKVLFGQGEPYVQLGKGEFGYDPALRPYPYDPARARKLLAETGYPRGFDVPCYNMNTPREPNIKELGQAVFAYLGAVGIRCNPIHGLEYSAWLAKVRRGNRPEMDGIINAMYGHGIPGDPGLAWSLTLHSWEPGKGFGASSYTSDPEIDALLEAQMHEMDRARREAIVREIARLKQERVEAGLTIYRPLQTIAWHDNIAYTPWAMPGIWHQMQEIGPAQPEKAR